MDHGKSCQRVCVYCASSQDAHEEYRTSARRLGTLFAEAGVTVVYGGGSIGSMGALADGALASGGEVVGILPEFMEQREWGHDGVTELRIVNDMHERKSSMLAGVDAVVALPGGCGTLEELLEALTWKRLGLKDCPIVMVNTRDYFEPLIRLLEKAVDEHFMTAEQRHLWSVVASPDDVLPAIHRAL